MSLRVNCICGAPIDPAYEPTSCPACGQTLGSPAPRKRRRWLAVGIVCAVAGIVSATLAGAVDRVREAAARSH
jgi:hypothetical protein